MSIKSNFIGFQKFVQVSHNINRILRRSSVNSSNLHLELLESELNNLWYSLLQSAPSQQATNVRGI
jgi:EAL domain-containing protein (putative c-di-GMP-specific phosphodiesterase class I)